MNKEAPEQKSPYALSLILEANQKNNWNVDDKFIEDFYHQRSIIFRDPEGKYATLQKFIEKLQEKYSREHLLEYASYHLAIGSTPIKEELKYWDIAGADSIVEFIKKLIEENSPKNKTTNL